MAHRSGNPPWQAYPSTATKVTATALTKMENAIDETPEMLSGESNDDEIVSGFRGENGRATDLVVREDGSVPQKSIQNWAPRLVEEGLAEAQQYDTVIAAGGFIGENGRATDLTLDEFGKIIPESAVRLAAALSPLIIPPTPVAPPKIDFYLQRSRGMVDSFGRPFVAKADVVSAWGDSLTDGWPMPPFQGDDSDSWPGVLDTGWAGAVYNGGKTGESADEIALRQGGYLLVTTGFTIPSGTTPVDVPYTQIIGWREDRSWTCEGTFLGVAGTFSRAPGLVLTFTRTTAGSATAVPAGTPFISTPGEQYKDSVQVIFAGRNDIGYTSAAGAIIPRVVSAYVAMMERPGAAHNRRLLVGTTTATTEGSGTTGYNNVTGIGKALSELYPDNYWDLRHYLVTQCIYDQGITPTTTDLTRMASDTLPGSIMVDSVHYTPATAALVAAKIKAQLTLRGWII